MKNLIAFIFVITIAVQPMRAQQIDMQQMRQDIDIAESILEEMFEGVKENERITFGNADLNNIHGTYLAGYGVFFKIGSLATSNIYIYGDDDGTVIHNNGTTYTIKSSGEDNKASKSKVTKQTVINKITRFLVRYGATIGQLDDSDKIAVLYNGAGESGWRMFIFSDDDQDEKKIALPVISVVAKKGDITAYNKGDISLQTFKGRLSVSVLKPGENKAQDLAIMADILETAFENEDEHQFEVSGDVNYQLIDNFGAFYSFDISNGFDSFGEAFSAFNRANWDSVIQLFTNVKWDSLFSVMGKSLSKVGALFSNMDSDSLTFDSLSVSIKKNFDTTAEDTIQIPNIDKSIKVAFQKRHQANTKRQEELLKDSKKALNQFISDLKGIIIKYGPTLDSVSPDQNIIFSIRINTIADELPDRLILQVKKSTLDAAASGDIGRQEAMNAISVRKF